MEIVGELPVTMTDMTPEERLRSVEEIISTFATDQEQTLVMPRETFDMLQSAAVSERSEALCLTYDPWAGDRDVDIVVFSDRFVVTRKPHQCVICWDEITVGQRVRSRREKDNDQQLTKTFYFCAPCCEAMALDAETGEFEAIEARYAIGQARADAKPIQT